MKVMIIKGGFSHCVENHPKTPTINCLVVIRLGQHLYKETTTINSEESTRNQQEINKKETSGAM